MIDRALHWRCIDAESFLRLRAAHESGRQGLEKRLVAVSPSCPAIAERADRNRYRLQIVNYRSMRWQLENYQKEAINSRSEVRIRMLELHVLFLHHLLGCMPLQRS